MMSIDGILLLILIRYWLMTTMNGDERLRLHVGKEKGSDVDVDDIKWDQFRHNIDATNRIQLAL